MISKNRPVESRSSTPLCITSYIKDILKLWGKNTPKHLQSKINFNFDFDFNFLKKWLKLILINLIQNIYVNIYPKHLDHEYVNVLHK